MKLYHELSASSLASALQRGIKRDTHGEKSDDAAIIKTDKFLDVHRPLAAKRAGLSRANNIYAYLGDEKTLIDIRNGQAVLLKQYAKGTQTRLLRVEAEIESCYVSDLDLYDEVKTAIGSKKAVALPELAARYWSAIVPLCEFHAGDIARPEAMITRDISPGEVTVIEP